MVRAWDYWFSIPGSIPTRTWEIFFSFKIEETCTLTTFVEQKLSLCVKKLSNFMQVWVQRFHAGVGPASYLCVVNSHLDSLRVFAFHSNLCVYFTHHFDCLYMYAVCGPLWFCRTYLTKLHFHSDQNLFTLHTRCFVLLQNSSTCINLLFTAAAGAV